MSQIILGPHNGLRINGTKPRKPKRKRTGQVTKKNASGETDCRVSGNPMAEHKAATLPALFLRSSGNSPSPPLPSTTSPTTSHSVSSLRDVKQGDTCGKDHQERNGYLWREVVPGPGQLSETMFQGPGPRCPSPASLHVTRHAIDFLTELDLPADEFQVHYVPRRSSSPQITDLPPSSHWSLVRKDDSFVQINITNITQFLEALSLISGGDETMPIPSLDSGRRLIDYLSHQHARLLQDELDEEDSEAYDEASHSLVRVRNSRVVDRIPFLNFHSELYARPTHFVPLEEWPRLSSLLPSLLDECMRYHLQCMNPYFPIRPRRLLMEWYSSLEDPTKDPLVLAVSGFFIRHMFIHHMPEWLNQQPDKYLLDAIQMRLGQLTRDALSDTFDVSSPHQIYALTLYNSTATTPQSLKATYHMIAVRMAMEMGIQPYDRVERGLTEREGALPDRPEPILTEQEELNTRLWWYLFQVDHFLLDSGVITCSLLSPKSDDHAAVSRLVLPQPCSLDELDEATGALVWHNVLKLWELRRRLVRKIESIDATHLAAMMAMRSSVETELSQYASELPPCLRSDTALKPENYRQMAQMYFTIGIERCTNRMLLHRMFLPSLEACESKPLTEFERQSACAVVESVSELFSMRKACLEISGCNTWPGELGRAVELTLAVLEYKDPTVTTRARLALMKGLRLLRSLPEVAWGDTMCTMYVDKIEEIFSGGPKPYGTDEWAAGTATVHDDRQRTSFSSAQSTFAYQNRNSPPEQEYKFPRRQSASTTSPNSTTATPPTYPVRSDSSPFNIPVKQEDEHSVWF
ncbi:hypothetical protein BZG36_00326 [Bifiguratus adelaidae]|uniref:Transcription factor domain-containing protein n=1 Tax=Bifiguratus adelaidae TaxID=1938954 RepID=A0A261Y7Z4_9FUNG|nr:hypothetical protein BZG36_00326 [Bifiguratus adelaidae]